MSSVCRCVVEFLCYKSSNFVEMMASFLLHWSLEFLLENWTYVKETCIAKIASQNSIFQLLNNVKTARERFYDLQKGRILPENYEPLRQDVKKRRGRYRVIHMTRAANKALGHNRINLSEGLKQLLQKSLENIKVVEETTRTLKLENQGWKKTSSSISRPHESWDIVDNSHVLESKKGTEAQNCGGLLRSSG